MTQSKEKSVKTQDEILADIEYARRESETKHHGYKDETELYRKLQSGDADCVDKFCRLFESGATGKLSDDGLRNKKYLFVAFMTMCTRYAIEGGMEEAYAYDLSDTYIRSADECADIQSLQRLFRRTVNDMVAGMKALLDRKAYSRPVNQAVSYVNKNLHTVTEVEELSRAAGLSKAYFISVFKEETGLSPMEYVRREKLKAAQKLLKYTDYDYSYIAYLFNFSSLSHFISVFRKYAGVTPRVYRERFYQHDRQDK